MRLRVRDPQGFTLGILFLILAVPAIALARGYRQGTAIEMGPGYFPLLVGWGLAIVGALVILGALRSDGPRVEWRPAVRPTFLLIASIILFAWSLRPLGAVVSVIVLMILSSFASVDSRRRETIGGALLVAAMCAAIFVKGLGVAIPLWPWFWS